MSINNQFKQFLCIQEEAIKLIKESKCDFHNMESHDELSRVLEILEPEYNLYNKKGIERFERMLITQDILTQTQKCPRILRKVYYDNRTKGYEIIDAILNIQDYFDSLKEEKLSEIQKLQLNQKLDKLLSLYIKAIEIVKKHIKTFSKNEEYKYVIKDLMNGLDVLQGGYNRRKKAGIIDLSRYLGMKSRPGHGLSRGFGEILGGCFPPEDKYWIDEILDAVYAIEKYYREM